MSDWKRAWLSPAAWYFFTAIVESCVFGLTIGYVTLTQPGSVGRLPVFAVAFLSMIGIFISLIKWTEILSELEKATREINESTGDFPREIQDGGE